MKGGVLQLICSKGIISESRGVGVLQGQEVRIGKEVKPNEGLIASVSIGMFSL